MVWRAAASVGASALMLAGCGGRLVLDEPTVQERLDRVDEEVFLCDAPAASTSRSLQTAAKDLGRRVRLAQRFVAATGHRPKSHRSAGSCGGTLEATSDHANGNTDYVITMAGLCVSTDDGDLVVDGVLEATQVGTPSDSGPVVEALEMRTAGPIAMTQGGRTVAFSLRGFQTRYGNPATYSPGAPDAANPDVTTVREATWTHVNTDGREDYLSDLEVERSGGAVATVTILGGRLGTSGEGFVDIATPESDPLVIDLGAFEIDSGSVALMGAGGTVLTVAPGATDGELVMTLDGQPLDRTVDCGAAAAPMLEGFIALVTEAPIF